MTNNVRKALKVFADLGVGSGPDHETETYQIERGAIRNARAVLESETDHWRPIKIEKLDGLNPDEEIGCFDGSGQWIALMTVREARTA